MVAVRNKMMCDKRMLFCLYASLLWGGLWISCLSDEVGGAPVITRHPEDTTVAVGGRADFYITATGNDLSYQWQREGLDIPGATETSYSVGSAQPADNGSVFRCVVSNPDGSVKSNAARLTVSSVNVIALKPFPQECSFMGTIKPSTVTQSQMNSHINTFYRRWKDSYLVAAKSTSGGYYINAPGTNTSGNALTHSEAHGYGMIIFALMAGNTSTIGEVNAKHYFDGMFRVMRNHRSSSSPSLMSWEILGNTTMEDQSPASRKTTATDGDLDIAYSLLLAHYQWGSHGEIDYRQEAVNTINAVLQYDIHASSNRILLGSWAKTGDYANATRSSDWMGGHLRAFHAATGNDRWLTVASTIYTIAQAVRNNNTGLVPDFIIGNPPVPAYPNFLESANDGNYFNNACRTPWRIAMDYGHYGTGEAKEFLTKLMDWVVTATNNNPSNFLNGYKLDGTPVGSQGRWGAYLAPILAAASSDVKYQAFLNSGWQTIKDFYPGSGYYSNSIILLDMLYISGNWWAPE